MYLTYFKGQWAEGNVPLYGAMDHSVWLGSSVFDGARAIRGHLPDLRPHLERVVRSAEQLGLRCPLTVEEMEALARAGVAKFPPRCRTVHPSAGVRLRGFSRARAGTEWLCTDAVRRADAAI